jgi:serine/threonine protein kinase
MLREKMTENTVDQSFARLGDYQLQERIGKGTSSTVYRAASADGRTVAVKVLEAAKARDQACLLQFYQGAKISMMLDHPHLIQTFEVGREGELHFLAMQYAPCGNLAQFIMESGWLYEDQALQIILRIAEALAVLHSRQMVHRDVNPANILFLDGQRPVLADFGLAQSPQEDLQLNIRQKALGTGPYAAPEQFETNRLVTSAADTYGLGATLYAMVTGKLPFALKSTRRMLREKRASAYRPAESWNPSLHPAILELIQACLHPCPTRRPSNADAFRVMATRCLESIKSGKSSLGGSLFLAAKCNSARSTAVPKDQWHILVPDAKGHAISRSGSKEQLIRLIQLWRVGPEVPAARCSEGPYIPLGRIATFQSYFELWKPQKKKGRLQASFRCLREKVETAIKKLSPLSQLRTTTES